MRIPRLLVPDLPARPAGVLRRCAAPFAALLTVVAGFAVVARVDPHQPGNYPPCPLVALTGVLCPGCGGLRSAHAIAHGQVLPALQANALACVGFLVGAVVLGVALWRAARGRPLSFSWRSAWGWLLGAGVLLFTLIRNTPYGTMLAP